MARIALIALLIACGGTQVHTVTLVNKTDRVIEEVFIYPTGSQQQGASRARLEPDGSTQVPIAAGNIDVRAVSAKIQIDATTRDRPTATLTVQLRGPMQLVFHDSTQQPPGLDNPDTLGVVFRAPKVESKPDDGSPVE